MSVVAIIQARMGSSRLPGKILERLGDGTILSWTVRAALASRLVDQVVVATTERPADDQTVAACRSLGVPVVRGPQDDVLSRYQMAASEYPCHWIVRLTADCPLLDPSVVDQCLGVIQADTNLDYVSTGIVPTLPRGLDVEAVTTEALERIAAEATGFHRSHVTSWAYTHPDRFQLAGVCSPLAAADLRVTVDTAEDLAVVRGVVRGLGTGLPRAAELVRWLRTHPEVTELNAHVTQKALEAG